MSTPPVIVFLDAATMDAGDVSLDPVAALGGRFVCHPTTTPNESAARAAEADILITNKVVVDEAVMAAAPNLRLIVVCATGVNNIDLEAAKQRGIVVSNVAGYSTVTVAQHAITLLLALATSVHRLAPESRRWAESPIFTRLEYPVTELAGKTLGIVGLGAIGSAVARIGAALGMDIIAMARAERPAPNGSDETVPRIPRNEFFSSADAVSLHCPLTAGNERMIDAETLCRMKNSAFLVNTARGGLVDERDLADALRTGAIAGAALDVLSSEPPPPDHILLDPAIPNLIVTPHTAWISREARTRLRDGLVRNIQTFLAGNPASRVA